MKHLMRLLIATGMLASLTACQGKFVPDPIDPRLPRISTEGANVAGAFMNGQRWEAVQTGSWSFGGGLDGNLIILLDSVQQTLQLTLDGQREGPDGSLSEPRRISFRLDNADGSLDRITGLRHRTFALDGPHHATVGADLFVDESLPPELSRAGQLYIHYVERSSEEPGSYYYTVAGTFWLTIDCEGCTPYEVHSGRFDYQVPDY